MVGRPCRLWPAAFHQVGRVPTTPAQSETQALFNQEVDFGRLLKTPQFKVARESIERATAQVDQAQHGLRYAGVSAALNQFTDRGLSELAAHVMQALEAACAMHRTEGRDEVLEALSAVPDLIHGLFMANWAGHFAAVAAGDSLARQVHAGVHQARTDTCRVLLGDNCPGRVVQRLTTLPIRPDSHLLFGGQLTSEFADLAATQQQWQLVSGTLAAAKPGLTRGWGWSQARSAGTPAD